MTADAGTTSSAPRTVHYLLSTRLFLVILGMLVAWGTTGCANAQISAVAVSPASVQAIPAVRQGFVSINFDDGYESAYVNAMPILDGAGFKTTHFIITQQIDRPGYVTKDQVLALRANGHEIGAHTRTHPHLPTLNDDGQRAEILGSYDDLVSLGIRPTWFAYPYGEYNDSSVVLARSTFLNARTVHGAPNDKSVDPLLLNCYPVTSGSSVYAIGDITKLIDGAQTNGTWLILLFHRVDETGNSISVPHDLIQQIADYLTAKQVRVVTMSEGWSLLSAATKP
jgi:peptidoglycan/xylan/chitin deacetylase (PgdA/CDA1 family)